MKYHTVDINGFKAELPILSLSSGIGIAFFNLHGDSELTEHCGKELAKLLTDCDIIITAESKGLQLAHCIARELGHRYYAVARKSKKLYMQDGIEITIQSSITTGKVQKLYLSKHDAELLKGKKVGIVDDVVSTGASLHGLEDLVNTAGGTIHKKAFVLAEGEAADREDVIYLAKIPLFE
ncbi:MAG: adenine phosphoribosyltransferase [Clostridia bacterium]|nr:adenine phosphoribosyltransferase [Clostridia bacterium]